MTVSDLQALLKDYPPTMTVAVHLHSEYTGDVQVSVRQLRPSGGYLTRPYGLGGGLSGRGSLLPFKDTLCIDAI